MGRFHHLHEGLTRPTERSHRLPFWTSKENPGNYKCRVIDLYYCKLRDRFPNAGGGGISDVDPGYWGRSWNAAYFGRWNYG